MGLVQIKKGLQSALELQNIDLFILLIESVQKVILHSQLVKRFMLSVSSYLNFTGVLEYQ